MAYWNSFQGNHPGVSPMQEQKVEYRNQGKAWWRGLFFNVLLIAAIVLTGVTFFLFRSFSDVILDTHRNQLSNITESAANNLEVYLRGFEGELESMVQLQQFLDAEKACTVGNFQPMEDFLEEMICARTDELVYLDYYCSPMGYCAKAGKQEKYTLAKVLGDDDTFQKIMIYKDESGDYYFSVGAESENGGWLSVYVSMRLVFEKTSGYLRMGENGYVMYKDSDGMILMHPVDEQIGIDVLADRKIMHPDFDFSELEVLIQHQLEGKTGVETYHSYWWGAENPVKIKKVSAYQPIFLGDDFIIVSSVIDYSEVAGQIQSHAVSMGLAVLVLVGIFVVLVIGLWQSLQRQDKAAEENLRLMEVNENLEKLRKEEELLAHQQRLQLVGTMTSGIAHEFNNLLTPIMGYSAMIMSGMDEDDDNYEDMQAILDSAEKAKEIIARINQFSSKNAEKMMSPIHVSEAIMKSLVITAAAKRRFIQMDVSLDQEHDVCMGNPTQIQQMLINLCNNALQAMGDQPGTLTIVGKPVKASEMKTEFFRDKKNMWFYRIEVRDTGCGMSQETLSQIFVPFFTTKRPGEGTGLGMSVVLRMVEAHDGLICADSEENKGTTFYIYLPLLENMEKELVEPAQD